MQYLIRWRNWVIRGIFTWVMIFGFALIIYAGPLALMLVVSSQSDSQTCSVLDHNFPTDFGSASKMLCRDNQHRVCCVQNSWLTLVSNYFFYGESLVDYFGVVDNRTVKYYLQYDSKTVDVIVHIFIRNFYVRWSSTIDSSRFLCILEVSCGSSCH